MSQSYKCHNEACPYYMTLNRFITPWKMVRIFGACMNWEAALSHNNKEPYLPHHLNSINVKNKPTSIPLTFHKESSLECSIRKCCMKNIRYFCSRTQLSILQIHLDTLPKLLCTHRYYLYIPVPKLNSHRIRLHGIFSVDYWHFYASKNQSLGIHTQKHSWHFIWLSKCCSKLLKTLLQCKISQYSMSPMILFACKTVWDQKESRKSMAL